MQKIKSHQVETQETQSQPTVTLEQIRDYRDKVMLQLSHYNHLISRFEKLNKRNSAKKCDQQKKEKESRKFSLALESSRQLQLIIEQIDVELAKRNNE